MNHTIADIITSELRELCSSCIHSQSCVYHLSSTKAVIQCELFELDKGDPLEQRLEGPAGLCGNCDHSAYCKLPGRKTGVWRCNEFR